MNKQNVIFLSGVLAMCVLGTTGANAVPSVRMLGTNSAKIGTNATVVKSDNNTNTSTQRLGTIRSKAVSAGAPVTVNKLTTQSVKADSNADSRLSLGKYIHSTGVSAGTIKPATTISSNAEVSSDEFNNLADQVRDLKASKQDVISVGDGLVLSQDNKISLSFGNGLTLSDEDEVVLDSSALQEQVAEEVASVLAEDYYTADEVDALLGQTYASTTPDAESYDSIKVADTFDVENFDFTK